ncbi:MAG TPA: hypothetical protein V6D06_01895 [Trichocoleus sp.]
MKTVPTVNDVFELAEQIGVALPQWLRAGDNWATTLHELSHWAVKPDSYLQRYLTRIAPYAPAMPLNSIPDAEEVMCWETGPTVRWFDGSEQQLSPNFVWLYELDPTPNEFGARAWGLQVLDKMGWCHPMECPELRTEFREEFGHPQFDANLLSGDSHPLSSYGPDQLRFMGIDIANGIFRPRVDVSFDGQWIRVSQEGAVIWERDVLAGLEVLSWETPRAVGQHDKPILLEDILALIDG